MCWVENDGIVHTISPLEPKRTGTNRVKETIQHSGKYYSDQSRLFDFTLHIFFKERLHFQTACRFLMPINQLSLALYFDRNRNKKNL